MSQQQPSCPICAFKGILISGTNVRTINCLQCGFTMTVEDWNALTNSDKQQMKRDALRDPKYARFARASLLDKIPRPTKCTNCGHTALMSKEQKFCGECGWRLRS